MSKATGKNLQSGINVSVGKNSFDFAINIAGKVIRHWNGGIVDLDHVDAATEELARGQNVELWNGGEIDPIKSDGS